MLPTITKLDELKENVRRYMQAVETVEEADADLTVRRKKREASKLRTFRKTLTMARTFMAFEDDGRWMFAPVKWAGYLDMTLDKYEANRIGQMSGTLGELACKRVCDFAEVGTNHPAFLALAAETKRVTGGKLPSQLASVCVVREPTESALSHSDEQIIESLLTITNKMKLSRIARAELARRLAA